MAARLVCNCCVALSRRNRSIHFGCTRSTTKEEAPAPVHPAETLCLRSPSTAAAESRSKSVEFANSSGSMPAKPKRCKRGRCRNQNRRLSCCKKRARRLHWRKLSNSPSKRAARISIVRHPMNGGNRLQVFSGCQWNLRRLRAGTPSSGDVVFGRRHYQHKCSRIFSSARGCPTFRINSGTSVPAARLELRYLIFSSCRNHSSRRQYVFPSRFWRCCVELSCSAALLRIDFNCRFCCGFVDGC